MSSAKGKRKAASGKEVASTKRPKSSASAKLPRRPKGMIELPVGTELTDLTKKRWKLGRLIGWGGFGALYLAISGVDEEAGENAEYVVKVEPHANGPLFSELAFYQRVAKPESINSWMKSHKLKHLGVPYYLGSGSIEHNGSRLRFMVMERYEQDVDKIFLDHDRHFDIRTVFTLGIRLLDILEYIHANEYAHADIKGSNLMMGYAHGKTDQIYLLDYGLTFRFSPGGQHKEYKEDPKRRHDGTVEFTSRDAHKGVAPSRRGDLEILGYVMLQWLCGRLPWENKLEDKEYVKNQKIRYMDDIPKLIKDCSLSTDTAELQSYLEYVATLEYDQTPDYARLRQVFQNGLKKRKMTDDGRSVQFSVSSKPSSKTSTKQATTTGRKKQPASAATNGVMEEKEAPAKRKPRSQKRSVEVSSSTDEDAPPRGVVTHAPSIGFPKMTKSASAKAADKKGKPTTARDSRSSSESPPKKSKASASRRTKTKAEETAAKPVRRGRPARVQKAAMVDMATSPVNWPKK